jgi:hypothetical protein
MRKLVGHYAVKFPVSQVAGSEGVFARYSYQGRNPAHTSFVWPLAEWKHNVFPAGTKSLIP